MSEYKVTDEYIATHWTRFKIILFVDRIIARKRRENGLDEKDGVERPEGEKTEVTEPEELEMFLLGPQEFARRKHRREQDAAQKKAQEEARAKIDQALNR